MAYTPPKPFVPETKVLLHLDCRREGDNLMALLLACTQDDRSSVPVLCNVVTIGINYAGGLLGITAVGPWPYQRCQPMDYGPPNHNVMFAWPPGQPDESPSLGKREFVLAIYSFLAVDEAPLPTLHQVPNNGLYVRGIAGRNVGQCPYWPIVILPSVAVPSANVPSGQPEALTNEPIRPPAID